MSPAGDRVLRTARDRTKMTPVLGALVKVAPSKPTNATELLSTPGRVSMMSEALAHDRVGARECRSWRKLQGHDQVGPIELRNEAGRRRRQPIVGQIEQPGISDEQDRRRCGSAYPSARHSHATELPNAQLKPRKNKRSGAPRYADKRSRLVAGHADAASAAAPPSPAKASAIRSTKSRSRLRS